MARRAASAIQAATHSYLVSQRDAAASAARHSPRSMIVEAIDKANGADGASKLGEAIRAQLATVARDSGKLGVNQVIPAARVRKAVGDKTSPADLDEMLSLVDQEAAEWANEHASELVGMRFVDGKWVVNPNPDWSIDKTTREALTRMVEQAELIGLTNDDLADAIEEMGEFSEVRAEMIARTETQFASLEGNRIGWRASGVVGSRRWMTSQEDPCEDCKSMDGEEVGVDEEFEGGDAPRHPRCECAERPILSEDAYD